MPEPDEIRPAEAATDPAPSAPAPPSPGIDEPARAGGELRIPTQFRLQAPWWAAESTDADEPEPEETARPQSESKGGAPKDAGAAPPRIPAPDDRLVAGQGAPEVDSRRAVPRPKARPARDTVPDGTPIHTPPPAADGTGPQPMPPTAPSGATGPQPTVGEPPAAAFGTGTGPQAMPRSADAPAGAMPLAAPVAMEALEANTDSRSSGPVLTPDAILPAGAELPPAVVLPPSEQTVSDVPKPQAPPKQEAPPKQDAPPAQDAPSKPEAPKQPAPKQSAPMHDGRATAADMPIVPPTPPAPPAPTATPPASVPSGSPMPNAPQAAAGAPASRPPFPGPNTSNDGTTGPQPFPPGPLGDGPGTGLAQRKRLLIGGGIAAVILVVCGVAVAGAVSGDDGGKAKAKKHHTGPAAGGSTAPSPGASAPVHHPVDINTEKTDTKPLALTEVFPSPTIQLDGRAFTRDSSSVNHQCGLTARGSMAAALAHEHCRSVVRVTFIGGDKKFAVTSGVAVLPSHDAAVKVSRAGNPGKYEWFRGLNGPHVPDIDGTGGYAAATVRGRYVAYAYATYTDGTHITPQDTQIKGLAQQFLDYGTKALDARARG